LYGESLVIKGKNVGQLIIHFHKQQGTHPRGAYEYKQVGRAFACAESKGEMNGKKADRCQHPRETEEWVELRNQLSVTKNLDKPVNYKGGSVSKRTLFGSEYSTELGGNLQEMQINYRHKLFRAGIAQWV
jgi:predicted 2-oxoglutarate/Fe(II)-dependent dioxygenase YbiX